MSGSGSGSSYSAHLPGKPLSSLCHNAYTQCEPLSLTVSHNKQRPTIFHSDHTYEDGEVK